jgi:uncharacterized protein (TIGR02996 family)
MNQVDLLLKAIAHDPGDDAAWFALADALEEQGDPRGATTRLSVELRRRLDDPAWPEWERRQRELSAAGVRVLLPRLSIPLAKGVRLELVLIPPGSYYMGSHGAESPPDADDDELPRHRVNLMRGFFLGVYAVTQSQWAEVLNESPSHFRGRNRPVERVSWHDSVRFCTHAVYGLPFRLPTEAEWEYSCRAGSATLFAFGDVITTDQINYDGNYSYNDSPKGVYRHQTTSVGTFAPNAWGLYEMHGNVWEWCSDWFGADYYGVSPADDPPGPAEGAARVLRGGSWFFSPRPCRTTYRFSGDPSTADDDYGCRVALSMGPWAQRAWEEYGVRYRRS